MAKPTIEPGILVPGGGGRRFAPRGGAKGLKPEIRLLIEALARDLVARETRRGEGSKYDSSCGDLRSIFQRSTE